MSFLFQAREVGAYRSLMVIWSVSDFPCVLLLWVAFRIRGLGSVGLSGSAGLRVYADFLGVALSCASIGLGGRTDSRWVYGGHGL